MSLEESIMKSRATKSVPRDKFDRHMQRARKQDIESRRQIFCEQAENNCQRAEQVTNLKSSVY